MPISFCASLSGAFSGPPPTSGPPDPPLPLSPWQQPKTLSDNDVYAVTAYILALNKIVGEEDVINAETLPKVKMPNRDGFIIRYPEKH